MAVLAEGCCGLLPPEKAGFRVIVREPVGLVM